MLEIGFLAIGAAIIGLGAVAVNHKSEEEKIGTENRAMERYIRCPPRFINGEETEEYRNWRSMSGEAKAERSECLQRMHEDTIKRREAKKNL